MRKISKRTREIASVALAIQASSRGDTIGDCHDAAGMRAWDSAWRLERAVWDRVMKEDYESWRARFAEAAQLIDEGWTPEGWR